MGDDKAKWSFGLHRIHDMPPYEWELNWTDPSGEAWSIEVLTLAEALHQISELFAEWPEGDGKP